LETSVFFHCRNQKIYNILGEYVFQQINRGSKVPQKFKETE